MLCFYRNGLHDMEYPGLDPGTEGGREWKHE